MNQKGSALLIVLVAVVLIAMGYVLYLKILPKTQTLPQNTNISVSPSPTSLLRTQYQNPFASPSASSYTNPFASSSPTNPFDSLQ